MDIQTVLESIGLAGNEIKVYLALVDLGSVRAGEITKRAGINRTNVYDALERLMERGLVSFVISGNTKQFEAAKPDRLLNYLTEQEHTLRIKKEHLTSILPILEKRRKLGKEPLEATLYKGRGGLKSVADDVLAAKQPVLVFGAEGSFVRLFTHYAEHWHRQRGKLNIPLKIIFNEKVRKVKSKANFPLCEMRFNKSLYDTPSTTWIFGDKVAFIVWSAQPIVTLVRSKEVAHSYRQFFQVLWNSSTC